jgi:hypothetical protein
MSKRPCRFYSYFYYDFLLNEQQVENCMDARTAWTEFTTKTAGKGKSDSTRIDKDSKFLEDDVYSSENASTHSPRAYSHRLHRLADPRAEEVSTV